MLPTINATDNLDQLTRWARFVAADQIPFATSVALNKTAQEATAAVTRLMPQVLDRPTDFTMRAWSFERSNKGRLTAVVFAKDSQAKYLRWQVAGGARQPNKKAQRLPSEIKLNEFGNIPRGEVARLIRAAQEGKRLTRRRSERVGVSSKVDLFYGDPGNGMPPGIFKRVVQGDRHVLVPIIVFPARAAQYKPRLPLVATVRGVVRTRFDANFAQAWSAAIRSAR